jgi:hypothetical protein
VTLTTPGHEARPTHERPRLLASGQQGDDDARRPGPPREEGPGEAASGSPALFALLQFGSSSHNQVW